MRCSAGCVNPRRVNPRRVNPLLVKLLLAGAMLAMGSTRAAQDNALRQLHIGQQVLRVEVAATPQQRQQGLMGRTRLAVNGGMLFVFDKADRHCFWMRNTPLPLSIAFIDGVGRIVEIADMQAYDDTRHCPASDVRYALELAQGGFLQRGIAPGAQITGLP